MYGRRRRASPWQQPLALPSPPHHVALTLVAQRRTGPVTLDQVLLETDAEPTTSPADALQQVLAEVQRIIAILGTHKRPLSRIAVTAVEAMAASTAIRVVEALTEAGLDSATLVPPPSTQSLAKRHPSNPNLFAATTEIPQRDRSADCGARNRTRSAGAHPRRQRTRAGRRPHPPRDGNRGDGLGHRRRRANRVQVAVRPVESRGLPRAGDRSGTNSGHAVSRHTTSTGVDRERRPHPSGCRHDHQCANHGRGDSTPHRGAGQDPLPSSVEPPPPSQDGAPPQGSEPASPAPPSPSPSPAEPAPTTSQAVEPPAPTDQRLPGPVPPAPADPQTGQGAPQ